MDDDMVEQFSAKATDYPLNISVGLHCRMHRIQRMNVDLSV